MSELEVRMSDEEHLARIACAARDFAGTTQAAVDAGVSHAKILPVLIVVLKESGIQLPAGLPFLKF